jgi:hypothetical protein
MILGKKMIKCQAELNTLDMTTLQFVLGLGSSCTQLTAPWLSSCCDHKKGTLKACAQTAKRGWREVPNITRNARDIGTNFARGWSVGVWLALAPKVWWAHGIISLKQRADDKQAVNEKNRLRQPPFGRRG